MKRLVILLILCAVALPAQTIWQVPIWNGRYYQWLTLGPSFTIKGNVIDVVVSTPTATHGHIVGAVLADSSGTYSIPAPATNLVLYRNGIRQTAGVDYELRSGIITTLFAWGSGNLVVADYQMPAQ